MTATEPLLSGVVGKPNVATPHAESEGTFRVTQNRSVDPVKAAGSVWSSVGDMAKWIRFVLDSGRVGGRRLVQERTFREWLTPQTVADPAIYPTFQLIRPHFITYGLGWFLHDYRGHAVAMHTGSINGMSAIVGLIPDQRLGIVVLENGDHIEARHALMLEAFDRFTGGPSQDWSARLLTLYGTAAEQARAAQRQAEQRRATDTRPSLPLVRYAGTYESATYGRVVVTEQGGGLRLQFGKRVGDLSHWQYDTFQARWTGSQAPSLVVFDPDGTGNVSGVRAFGATFVRQR
jgi:hypothetical protein